MVPVTPWARPEVETRLSHSTEVTWQTMVARCWVLSQRICCFPKQKSPSPSPEPRAGRKGMRPRHPHSSQPPAPPASSRLPAVVPPPAARGRPVPGGPALVLPASMGSAEKWMSPGSWPSEESLWA